MTLLALSDAPASTWNGKLFCSDCVTVHDCVAEGMCLNRIARLRLGHDTDNDIEFAEAD